MMLRLQNIEILLSQNKFSGLFCFFFNPIKFAKISCAKFAYRMCVCLCVCVYVCNAQTLGKIKPFSDNPRLAMPFQTNLDKMANCPEREREQFAVYYTGPQNFMMMFSYSLVTFTELSFINWFIKFQPLFLIYRWVN